MGSGTSRGKKVAPACVSEVNVTKTAAGVASPKRDSRSLKALKVRGAVRNARSRAQQDCHSEGHDSEFSGEEEEEEEDLDAQLDKVLAAYEGRDRATLKKHASKKTFVRSKTYGLCHFGREDADDDPDPNPRVKTEGEPRGPRTRGVNKRSNDAFTAGGPGQQNSSSQAFLTRGALSGALPTSEKQSTFHGSSLAMPVILYNGSEEELMDTIERDFS